MECFEIFMILAQIVLHVSERQFSVLVGYGREWEFQPGKLILLALPDDLDSFLALLGFYVGEYVLQPSHTAGPRIHPLVFMKIVPRGVGDVHHDLVSVKGPNSWDSSEKLVDGAKRGLVFYQCHEFG